MMAGKLSDYSRDGVLNHLFRNTSLTSPTTVYLALFSTVPNADGTGGTEITGGGYARQSVTLSAPEAGDSGRKVVFANDVDFPKATGAYPADVAGFAYFDAASGGNQLAQGTLSSAVTIETDDIFRAEADDTYIELD